MQSKATLAHVVSYANRLPPQGQAPDVLSWRCALDNYEPAPRNEAYGHAVGYSIRNGNGRGLVVWATDFGAVGSRLHLGLHKALIIVDNGQTVVPMYAAGWNPTDEPDAVFFHPFPLSVGVRSDNGRPVDMSGWLLGPRTAYHLKVRDISAQAEGLNR